MRKYRMFNLQNKEDRTTFRCENTWNWFSQFSITFLMCWAIYSKTTDFNGIYSIDSFDAKLLTVIWYININSVIRINVCMVNNIHERTNICDANGCHNKPKALFSPNGNNSNCTMETICFIWIHMQTNPPRKKPHTHTHKTKSSHLISVFIRYFYW